MERKEKIPPNCDTTGKQNRKKILRTEKMAGAGRLASMLPLAAAIVLSGCEGDLGERLQSGKVLAWAGLQGRWVGPVVPVAENCGPTTSGLMSIGEKGFAFDPFQSTTVITGDLDQKGRLSGKLRRSGGDHQTVSMTFEATAASDAITGTLQSGRCSWNVTLHRG